MSKARAAARGYRRRGRPSLVYDHGVVSRLLGGVEEGMSLTAAAALAGVHVRSVHEWDTRGLVEQDRREEHWTDPCPECGATSHTPQHRAHSAQPAVDDEEVYVQFSQALARARASVEQVFMEAIRKTVVGGEVTKEVTRTLRDGSEEYEVTRTAPDGKLALEVLARTRPSLYGRTKEPVPVTTAPGAPLEVTGPGGEPVRVDVDLSGLAATVRQALAKQQEELPPGQPDGPAVIEGVVVRSHAEAESA